MNQKQFALLAALSLLPLTVFAQESAGTHSSHASHTAGSVAVADEASTKSQGKSEGKKKRKKEAAQEIKNTKCPVTGEKIDAMGKVSYVTHNGKKVALCCTACKDKFMSDADKYTKAAEEDAAASANAVKTQ